LTTRKHAFYGILAMVSLLGLGITQSARANLITNGDFETGNFNGWAVMPAPPLETLLSVVPGPGPDTTNMARFGALGTNFDRISQTFATTPGAFYTLTFFYQVGNPPEPRTAFNGFDVLWNGVSIGGGLFPQFDVNPGYISPTFILQATSASTTLEFDGRNRPWWDYLDDVSVNLASVPDAGSTLPLLSFALLGVAVLRRKLRC
jgi:VPDSG-CTERM motif